MSDQIIYVRNHSVRIKELLQESQLESQLADAGCFWPKTDDCCPIKGAFLSSDFLSRTIEYIFQGCTYRVEQLKLLTDAARLSPLS